MITHKKKYVIDTNVIISRLMIPNSNPTKAVQYVLNNGMLLLSDEIIEEIDKILFKSKFDKYLSLESRKLFLEGLIMIAQKIDIDTQIEVCRDPKDNKILEAAVSGKASIIITGDQDLLVIRSYGNIDILSPTDFMEQLNNNKSDT